MLLIYRKLSECLRIVTAKYLHSKPNSQNGWSLRSHQTVSLKNV